MLRHCFLYSAFPADNPFLQEWQNKDQPYCEGKYYYGSSEAMGYMQFESILKFYGEQLP